MAQLLSFLYIPNLKYLNGSLKNKEPNFGSNQRNMATYSIRSTIVEGVRVTLDADNKFKQLVCGNNRLFRYGLE